MNKHTSRNRLAALLASTALIAAACGADTATDIAVGAADDAAETVEQVVDSEEEAMEEEAMDEEAMDEEAMDEEAMEEDAMDEEAMEEDAMDEDASHDDEESLGGAPIALEFSGLEPLGDDFVYEGWVVVDGSPVSTGRFTLDEVDGERNYTAESLASQNDLDNASDFVLTIEPAVGDDPAPADAKPLGGAIVDGVAELSIAHPAALGNDFATAAGSFILATPTTETTNDDYSGVWFLEITEDGPVGTLDVPELPAGWVYEGWVVIDGEVISTGRFTDPLAADDFNGFSGDLGSPPFPGEDFIVNAPEDLEFPVNLTEGGNQVVISIEPEDDDSPAPFAFKPLAAEIAEGAEVETSIALGAGPAFPTGTATIG